MRERLSLLLLAWVLAAPLGCGRPEAPIGDDRLSLRDRGLLREGFLADVVLFDPDSVGDRATFDDPHQLSVGVRDVWVNGVRVLAGGEHTGATPGRFVKGPGA